MMPERRIIEEIMAVVADRKSNPPTERSYVAGLLEKGPSKIGAKILEEAGEVASAALETDSQARAHLVHEAADLVFHTLVMLGCKDIGWNEVEDELARRFGVSGVAEKEARGRPQEPE
jgi:phosphoribosyl-ATP pyrophosphohydrolase